VTTGEPSHIQGSERHRILFATPMLVLLCVIWGMTFPATRSALAVTDPLQFLALRFGLAIILTTPFMVIRWLRISKHEASSRERIIPTFRRGVWIGIFLFLGFVLQTVGMRYTTASRAGFFTGLLVVMTPPLALLLRTSRMPGIAWLGIPVAVGGVYLMTDPGAGGLNVGDWLTIACALVFALQMIALEVVARTGRDTWTLTYAQMLTVGMGALVWCLIEGNGFRITTTGWLAVLYTGIFGGIIATWMQTRFQPMVPAGHAAIVFTAEPIFAALFAWVLLNESWSLRGLMGAALILAAMVISSLSAVRK